MRDYDWTTRRYFKKFMSGEWRPNTKMHEQIMKKSEVQYPKSIMRTENFNGTTKDELYFYFLAAKRKHSRIQTIKSIQHIKTEAD